MINTIEDSRTEFKSKLVDDLEESVIAFLNLRSDASASGILLAPNLISIRAYWPSAAW